MKLSHSLLTLSLACLALAPQLAQADGAKKGPHSVALMLGPVFGISDDSGKDAQFDLAEVYLYHLSGEPSGLHVGLEVQEGGGKYFHLSAGARAGYDLQIAQLPLYITPVARVGFSVIDVITTEAYFNLCLGAEAKYELPMGIALILRPLAIDMSFGKATVIGYDLLAGASYTF
ncbi:MAG: hypothetical protein U1E65_29980 [Myxococcota bacterium]